MGGLVALTLVVVGVLVAIAGAAWLAGPWALVAGGALIAAIGGFAVDVGARRR